jgi:hypothetical protein
LGATGFLSIKRTGNVFRRNGDMRRAQARRKALIDKGRQRRAREAAAAQQRKNADIVNRTWARIGS